MSVNQIMRQKLEARFHPLALDITDESDLHKGHVGARPSGGGETHFRVKIVAKAFEGLSRVARQRLVYETLAEELGYPVHALSVKALTPQEDEAR